MAEIKHQLIVPAGAEEPRLNVAERTVIEKHTSVRPYVVHEAIVQEGVHELSRSNQALAWSGLAAGFSMGLSFIGEGLLTSHLPHAPWAPLIAKFGYSFGFIAVIMGHQQLFTENTLTAVLPFLKNRSSTTLWQVARLWTVVLLANIAGAHIVAWVLGNTPAFGAEARSAFFEIGRNAADVTFGEATLRGILAGWIIALMVWILAGTTQHARLWVILLLTYLVALGNLTHIVAGSVEVLFLVMTGSLSWVACVSGYMLPTLLGNCIGGVALVSALNHAQVVSDQPKRKHVKLSR